jgi:putative peptide zinc metalloprotease protein
MPRIDQSAIPLGEMRVIRGYALIWLVGHAAALGTLFFITLPILWGYGLKIISVLMGTQSTPYEVVDALILSLTGGGTQVAGLALWLRSLYKARKGESNELAAD